MVYILITTALFIGYSILEGFREGKYFYFRNQCFDREHQKYDIHNYFAAQRGIVIILLCIMHKWYVAIGLFFGLSAIFPFFHDGQYYATRNNIKNAIYRKRWKDYGDGSAKMDFTWKERVIMLIIGTILITLSIYLNEL